MVFVTQIIVSNAIELAKPLVDNCRAARKMEAAETPDHQVSGPEEELGMEDYDSPFSDFDEVIIQYGYATLFVVALPLTPLLYLINNIVEMYLDSYKLCKLTRRPEPRGAVDIGTWQAMLNLQGYLAVVSNCALITLVANQSIGLSKLETEGSFTLVSVLAFVATEHVFILLKEAIAYFIPDIPEEVVLRHRRQDYIVNALIWDMDVEDIPDDELVHDDNDEANDNQEEGLVEEKQDQEASSRNVLTYYQLNRIPTSYKLGMAAVTGKDQYGEVMQQDDGGVASSPPP